MIVLLAALQYVFTPSSAPIHLFLLFVALWAFGFAMLRAAPLFGAAGTALWGIVSAAGALRMGHGALLAAASLSASAAAALHLALLLRARRRPA